jgi:hypothetical protein
MQSFNTSMISSIVAPAFHYVHVDSLDHIGAIYGSGVMLPKEVELLSIAFDASYTHQRTFDVAPRAGRIHEI